MVEEFKKNDAKAIEIDQKISKPHAKLDKLQNDRERILNILNLLRENLISKFYLVKRQVDTLLEAKSSYDKFGYTNLNTIEVAFYELCRVINIIDTIRSLWDNKFVNLRNKTSNCMSLLGNQSP